MTDIPAHSNYSGLLLHIFFLKALLPLCIIIHFLGQRHLANGNAWTGCRSNPCCVTASGDRGLWNEHKSFRILPKAFTMPIFWVYMYLKEAMWGQGAHLFICTGAEKEKAFPRFSIFLVRDRPLLTFNTLMGKESEQNSKMEMVINMLMLGRGAGKSSFYTRPSAIYWRARACVPECVRRGKTEIEKEQEWTGNVHVHVRAHAHSHSHFVLRVNKREPHVNVPPFSFNRPLETVQRAFCWLIGEIRSGGAGGPSETRRASFFSIGWKHPTQ